MLRLTREEYGKQREEYYAFRKEKKDGNDRERLELDRIKEANSRRSEEEAEVEQIWQAEVISAEDAVREERVPWKLEVYGMVKKTRCTIVRSLAPQVKAELNSKKQKDQIKENMACLDNMSCFPGQVEMQDQRKEECQLVCQKRQDRPVGALSGFHGKLHRKRQAWEDKHRNHEKKKKTLEDWDGKRTSLSKCMTKGCERTPN